jgi:hypothetical protein
MTTQNLAQEKRKKARLCLECDIKIYIQDTKIAFNGRLLNINSRAMAFMTEQALSIETPHFFSFILPNEKEELKNIKGKITRQEKIGEKYLTVLSFLSIPKVEMLNVFKYIQKAIKNDTI